MTGSVSNAAGCAITKSGSGAAVITGPQTHAVGASLTVTGGSVRLDSDAGTAAVVSSPATANLSVAVSSGQLKLDADQTLRAMTTTVPARLALKLDCELVPLHVERLGGARYRVCLCAPIRRRDPSAAVTEQALDMSAQMNALFEQWIRETPGEWMCLARRFPKDIDKAARR